MSICDSDAAEGGRRVVGGVALLLIVGRGGDAVFGAVCEVVRGGASAQAYCAGLTAATAGVQFVAAVVTASCSLARTRDGGWLPSVGPCGVLRGATAEVTAGVGMEPEVVGAIAALAPANLVR